MITFSIPKSTKYSLMFFLTQKSIIWSSFNPHQHRLGSRQVFFFPESRFIDPACVVRTSWKQRRASEKAAAWNGNIAKRACLLLLPVHPPQGNLWTPWSVHPGVPWIFFSQVPLILSPVWRDFLNSWWIWKKRKKPRPTWSKAKDLDLCGNTDVKNWGLMREKCRA